MINSYISGDDLVIVESPTHDRTIPLAAIAARRELLGYDDLMECVEATIYLQDHGEPEPDPVTRQNAWTEPYQLLRVREEAREDEARRARQDCCTEDVVVERANKAAYDAVHVPMDDGECAMDRCRRTVRGKLGLPDPTKNSGADTRSKRPPAPQRRPEALRSIRPSGGKAEVGDLIAGQAAYLHASTRWFLHQLTGNETDPLEDMENPE